MRNGDNLYWGKTGWGRWYRYGGHWGGCRFTASRSPKRRGWSAWCMRGGSWRNGGWWIWCGQRCGDDHNLGKHQGPETWLGMGRCGRDNNVEASKEKGEGVETMRLEEENVIDKIQPELGFSRVEWGCPIQGIPWTGGGHAGAYGCSLDLEVKSGVEEEDSCEWEWTGWVGWGIEWMVRFKIINSIFFGSSYRNCNSRVEKPWGWGILMYMEVTSKVAPLVLGGIAQYQGNYWCIGIRRGPHSILKPPCQLPLNPH